MSNMIGNKGYSSDCGGGTNTGGGGIQSGQTSLSPPPYMLNSPYSGGGGGTGSGSAVNCAQFGTSSSCMSPNNTNVGSLTPYGNPGLNSSPGGPSPQQYQVPYNGLNGVNSGSCDNLSSSPVLQRTSSVFRENSVIANGLGSFNSSNSANAAAAAAAAAASKYRRSYTHAKPPYSYISLITMAIQVRKINFENLEIIISLQYFYSAHCAFA